MNPPVSSASARFACTAALLAFLVLVRIPAPSLCADTLTYATGSSAASTVAALNNGDTALVSGSTGVVTLSSTAFPLAPAGALAVSDWARADATFILPATKNDLAFAPASSPVGGSGWAVLESAAGRIFNITVAGGSNTLNLDRVILTGATTAAAIETAGGATAMLTIGGPVVFHKNNSTGAGAGLRTNSAFTFLDAVVFDQNVGGHTISTDAWTTTSYGGGVGMTVSANAIFKGDALFASNTAAFSGGGAYLAGLSTANAALNKAVFEQDARFIGNYAGASGAINSNGGGLYYGGPGNAAFTATLDFRGDLVLDANSGLTGGGLHVPGLVNITFAGDVTVTNNTARAATGGGMNVNDSLLVIAPGPAHAVAINGNTAATHGGGIQSAGAGAGVVINAGAITIAGNLALAASATGGGIRAGGSIALTGAFDIAGNTAAYGGALAARVVDIAGSGTFAGNTATQRGGAIYLTGSYAGGGARLLLAAAGGDIVFTGNTAAATPGSAAVYFDNSAATPGALLALDAEAGRSILFYDPIYYGAGKVLTVTKTGDGAILFDRHYQEAAANTTVSAGLFAVANSATWSRVTGNTFTLAAPATLAGDGAVQAGTLTLADGSCLQAWDSGTLTLNATTRHYGNNLQLSGHGLIDAGAPLNAALVTVGPDLASGRADFVARAGGTAAPATLALVATDTLTLAAGGTFRFDLFATGTADLLDARGGLALAGGATVDLGLLATGSFNLVSWAGAAGPASAAGLALTVNGATPTARTDTALGVDPAAGALYVTNTTFGLSLRWTAAASGTALWTADPSDPAAANWLDTTTGPSGGTETRFRDGDSVTFDATAASPAVTIAPAGVTASEINIAGAADRTFTGSGALAADAASAPAHTRLAGSGASGKLIKTGAGAVTFANTAANRFAGGIELAGGALVFANSANTVAGGAVISGGTLAISTAAQLDTTGATVTLAGGALARLASVADAAALPHALVFSAGQTGALEIAPSATVAFARTPAGTGPLAKTGPGTLRVLPAAGAASFAGATLIESGVLWLAPGATLAGAVTVAPGATAAGAGVFSGNVSVAPGGVLQAGGLSAGGTLTIGGTLALAGNATVSLNIFNGSNDRLVLSAGTAALAAAATNIVSITGDIQSGTYLLGNAVQLADAGATLKINGAVVDPSLRFTAGLGKTAAGDTLTFAYGADDSRYMDWTAASGTALWDTGLDNWADYDGGASVPVAGKTKFQNRDTVRIATAAGGTITLAAAAIVSDLVVETSSGTLALAGESITAAATVNGTLIAAPTARLVKTGLGALRLANTANTFAGGVSLRAGALEFSTAAQLGAGAAEITAAPAVGDTVTLRPLADLTLANPLILAAAASASLPGSARVPRADEEGRSAPRQTADGETPSASPRDAGAPQAALGQRGTGILPVVAAATPALALDIPAAARVTLTGAISGTGLVAKTGPGALVYSNPALAPDVATRLDAGVLELRDIAAPSSFAHTFILNGGWLDLSANPAAFTGTDATAANDWTALTLATAAGAATSGGVIGAADQITLGAGEVGFRIGGDTDAENGLYVVIRAAGPAAGGTTIFTRQNTYAGRTLIESGALSVSADNQLGDPALARAVVLAGGTLAARASFNSARRLEITDAGGAVDIAENATVALAGSWNAGGPPATPPILEKRGPGTLVLSGSLAHAGPTLVTAGTLRAPAEFLPGETRLADAALEFAQIADATFTGTITGDGLILKTGPAALTLASAAGVAARELVIQSGALALNPAATLSLADRLRIAPGATLRGAGLVTTATLVNHGEIRVGRAAGAATHGTLAIAGNYEGGGTVHLAVGTLGPSGIQADKLAITGNATGATVIHFTQPDGPQPALPTGYGLPDALVSFASAAPGAFTQSADSSIVFGATEYIWQQTASDGGRWRATTISEATAATGADAAALLAGKAAAGSLASRLAALRLAGDTGAGPAFWIDGLHRHDRLRDSIYKDATSTLYGVQLGADYRRAKDGRALALGAFYDHAQSTFDQPGTRATARAENDAGGVFGMVQAGPFHLELLARASSETYRVTAAGDPEFRVKGRGFLQSVSAGCAIAATREWHIEPQLSLTRQRVDLDPATSPAGITYRFDDTKSMEARAAIQLWQDHTRRNGLVIRPSLRLAWLYDFNGDSAFTANGERFATTLGGSACQLDATLDLQLTRRLAATAAAAYLFGSKLESYTATLGLAWHW